MSKATFDSDVRKNRENVEKHGVSFNEAQRAFGDPKRVVAEGTAHSQSAKRYFRFGAGYWRKGKAIYERENQIRR